MTTVAQEVITDGGIEVGLQAGRITIALSGVRDGEEVTVRWIDEPVARVAAGAGSLYGFAEGKAEAVVSGGPIAVEVSRAATSVILQVNGRTVLRGNATTSVLDADVVSQTSDRIVLSFVER
jgi:antitoxin (DNA-binding transcriptional repressor) of toxin-antitoxin stability system